MTWSMNEAEALARKAARGAGMCWGLAEETGKATRVLLEHGIDAGGLLAAWLTQLSAASYEVVAPLTEGPTWQASGGTLCPIATGAALSDGCATLTVNAPVAAGRIAYPVFLLPFARSVAVRTGTGLQLEWPGVAITVTADTIHLHGDRAALLAPVADSLRCTPAGPGPLPDPGTRLPRVTRAEMNADCAARLSHFAHRTYAPATDASRLAGAGAGLSDND